MQRYLLNISYIGTNFSGIQRIVNKLENKPIDCSTVQGAIEIAIAKLKPKNEIKLILSSRTDSGVHALHSTVHIDLERYQTEPYDTVAFSSVLNKYFTRNKLPIRVHNIEIVPDSFHARYSVKSRTYLYRFAVAKKAPEKSCSYSSFTTFIPIEEIDRCFFVFNNTFDVEKAIKVANLFKGIHDFRTFMGLNSQNKSQDHARFAVRQIKNIELRESKSRCLSCNADKAAEIFNYWELEITARSFLYRQVRRTVATIVAVAQGRITPQDVYEMLTIPSSNSWCPQVSTAPPQGLYLCRVEYDNNDKIFKLEENREV